MRGLNRSFLQNNIDNLVNSAYTDQIARNDMSHEDLNYLLLGYWFLLKPYLKQWTCPTSEMGGFISENQG